MLASIADPQRAPEMLAVRESIRGWRFYDGFRTDIASPVRIPQIGTFTPVLNNDGTDLPAALQTILEIGDDEALRRTIDDAFPKSRVHIEVQNGRFEVKLQQHGLLRPLSAAELSDGTLRFLLWTAALLTPRPPELMVLNEPETSLHPDLLPALARLIIAGSSDLARDYENTRRAPNQRGLRPTRLAAAAFHLALRPSVSALIGMLLPRILNFPGLVPTLLRTLAKGSANPE